MWGGGRDTLYNDMGEDTPFVTPYPTVYITDHRSVYAMLALCGVLSINSTTERNSVR